LYYIRKEKKMGNFCCMPPPPNIPKALEETHTRPPTPFQRVEYSFNGRRWSPYEDDEVPDFIR
jgi:hypothetical protein